MNKENNSLPSNVIINNAIIDSLIPENVSSSNSSLNQIRRRDSLPVPKVKRLLSFSKNSDTEIMNRKNSCHMPRQTTNLITNIKEIYENNMNLYMDILDNESNPNYLRKIPEEPEKILDAPQLIDDYYLNLLDWGNQNILSVCLGNIIYLWNGDTGQTSNLNRNQENSNICSLSFMNNGTCIGVGLEEGATELWDIEKNSKLRTLKSHRDRVSSLSWNNYILTTGSKDSFIYNHDVRIRDHIVHKMINGHHKEVCSLKWNNDLQVLASGGNDNIVCLWDVKSVNSNSNHSIWNLIERNMENSECTCVKPLYVLNSHEAAVKALAWSPWERGRLATGGGKKDNNIKFWNAENGSLLHSYDTGSQVCALIWNRYEKEIISSHGYSKNQITVWNYPKMSRVVDLVGHMNRVLYLAISPDGCKLVSGSSDETLRFWNINDSERIKELNQQSDFNQLRCLTLMNIR